MPVHLKIDTGMQRVGAHPHTVASIVASIEERFPAVVLAGVFTHLAVADEPDDPFTATQLATLRRRAQPCALGARRPRGELGGRAGPIRTRG